MSRKRKDNIQIGNKKEQRYNDKEKEEAERENGILDIKGLIRKNGIKKFLREKRSILTNPKGRRNSQEQRDQKKKKWCFLDGV